MTNNTIHSVPRELLEEVMLAAQRMPVRGPSIRAKLHAILSATSPAGVDGLEVVGYVSQDDIKWQGDCTLRLKPYSDYVIPLCRLSDAQRTIAELHDELDAAREILAQQGRNNTELRAERDTLRQQLAEREATIARLETGIPRIQEQSHQMRQQRDRLAELLADVKADYTHAIHWEDMHATMKRIAAALAEVKP